MRMIMKTLWETAQATGLKGQAADGAWNMREGTVIKKPSVVDVLAAQGLFVHSSSAPRRFRTSPAGWSWLRVGRH